MSYLEYELNNINERNSPKYNQWKNEVKSHEDNACQRYGFENNLHELHIE